MLYNKKLVGDQFLDRLRVLGREYKGVHAVHLHPCSNIWELPLFSFMCFVSGLRQNYDGVVRGACGGCGM